MSEPMQPAPQKDGGLKQSPQTTPAPDQGLNKVGGGETRGDGVDDSEAGGMIGEGGTPADDGL